MAAERINNRSKTKSKKPHQCNSGQLTKFTQETSKQRQHGYFCQQYNSEEKTSSNLVWQDTACRSKSEKKYIGFNYTLPLSWWWCFQILACEQQLDRWLCWRRMLRTRWRPADPLAGLKTNLNQDFWDSKQICLKFQTWCVKSNWTGEIVLDTKLFAEAPSFFFFQTRCFFIKSPNQTFFIQKFSEPDVFFLIFLTTRWFFNNSPNQMCCRLSFADSPVLGCRTLPTWGDKFLVWWTHSSFDDENAFFLGMRRVSDWKILQQRPLEKWEIRYKKKHL